MENYERMIIPTLKNLARERGLRRYSRLKKSELMRKLREPIPPRDHTRTQLIQLARERGLRGYSRLRKADLLQRLRASGDLLLDRENDVRMVDVTFLTPTPFTPASSSSNDVKDYLDYLDNNVRQIPKSLSYRSAPELRRLLKLKKMQEEIKSIYNRLKLFKVRETNSALRNFAKAYTINAIEGYDARSFLQNARKNITSVLRNNRRTKVKLILRCYMEFERTNEIRAYAFHSEIEVNLDGTDEKEIYDRMMERVLENLSTFISGKGGTDVRFYRVIKLELHTVSYNPLRGETWIPLPKELDDKKAIINIQNKDNKCFLCCVLRALNPDRNPQRLDKKLMDKENSLNMEGILYPVSLKEGINNFEKQNPTISITVLGYDGKSFHPLRKSDNTDRKHKIRLMLIEKDGVKHYCLIKNISRLLSSQVFNNHHGEHYFCDCCLNVFWCEEALNKHLEYCSKHEAVKIQMPEKGTMLKFINYHRSERVSFIVYADLECCNKPIQSCEPNPQSRYTKQYQKHEPSSFYYYIKCFDDKVYKPVIRSYTGKDAAQKFVEMLEEDIKMIANIPEKKMIFGKEEAERFKKETECWICKGEFNDDKNYKVRDHCHFTGRYRGAAHNNCNLKYRKPNFTPVVFHNLSGYDSHLFIKNLGFGVGDIDCIPNEERYISFTKTRGP